MRTFFLIFAYCIILLSNAQITLRITQLPSNTPSGATIYFAGSINGWNPGDNNFSLTEDGQGFKTITIPEGTGAVQYKFTRGSWATVETNATGSDISNRTFTFNGQPQTINLTVQSWKDLGSGGTSTAASNVQILNANFFMPQLNRNRRIWLYLPPDYQTTTKTYPVIYMHDGQNLFDNLTAFGGNEWRVDEALNNLHQNGDYGAIVVGIDNGGSHRINEYGPWVNPQYGGGQGSLYMDFIVETLKPYIDANFRTKPQAPFTAMIGSSLGALISTYGQVRFTQTFEKVGSFSPAYWFNLSELNNYIQNTSSNLVNARYYFVAGQNESTTMVSNINLIRNALLTKGLTTSNTLTKIDSYGQHNEIYWRGEFAAAYQWLFATTNLSNETLSLNEKVIVQLNKNLIYAKGIDTTKVFNLFDIGGKKINQIKLEEGNNVLNIDLSPGIYFLKNDEISLKFYQ
jgi:alpha-glucosidase